MANRRYIDFPIASTVGDNDIILIWQGGLNKQTTKATFLSGLPENLDELNDVTISGLTNGQILRYDSVTGKWVNTDQGNLDLNDLNDVSIVSPSNGQVLVYNSSTGKWENSSGGYVPYTGAVTTVNLGAQTIQAGSFVKAGGTSSQFLKADGSVDSTAYGTGTVTSVGLTMPSAFSVANSPITSSGTLAVTATGNTTQYIAGDGSLVTFPITGQAGTLIREVRNNTGATLTKGTVVYINGALGNKPTVAKAIATGDSTSAQTFGLIQADIPNNSNGYLVAFGDLDGINTSGITEGSQLYLSSSVAGGYTTVKQYAPNHLVYIGVVTRAHPTDGRIEVRIQNGYEMDELHNVAAQNPDNNDILQYKTSTNLWTKVAGTTTNIAEGTNLYYTEARVNANANVAANTAARHNAVTLGTANGLSLSTQVLSLGLASSGVTGALSGTDWSTFNAKQNALTLTTTGTSGAATLVGSTLNIPIYSPDLSGYVPTSRTITINGTTQDLSANRTFNVGTVTSVGLSSATSGVTIGSTPVTSSGTITLAIATASGSQQGLLSAADWTTFNNKQNALTNPVTGTGTTNYLPKFTGSTTIGNSNIQDSGSQVTVGAGLYINAGTNTNVGNGIHAYYESNYAQIQLNGATGSLIDFSTSGTDFLGRIIYTNSTNVMDFHTASGTSRLTIGGNVIVNTNLLVGTTSDNGSRLQVSGEGRFTNSDGADLIRYAATGVNTNFATKIVSGANDVLVFRRQHVSVGGLDIMALGFNGNVGIGTTSPNGVWSGDNRTLNILSPGNFSSELVLSRSAGSVAAASVSNFLSGTTADFGIYTTAALNYVVYTNNTERMRITSSGNVGIGTSSPSGLLHVKSSGAYGSLLVDNTGTTGGGYFASLQNGSTRGIIAVTGAIEGNTTSDFGMFAETGGALRFYVNGSATRVMSLTSGGNLLVGTTSDAGFRMAINGPDGTSYLKFTSTAAATGGRIGYNGNEMRIDQQENANLIFRTNGSTQLTISSTGAATFSSSVTATNLLTTSMSGSAINIRGDESLNSNFGITWTTPTYNGGIAAIRVARRGASDASDMMFFTSPNGDIPNERMRITSGGNVLIGTTTDVGARLHVAGDIRTQAPTGGSAVNWRLGTARAGTITPNATVRVEIGGVLVDLDARYV